MVCATSKTSYTQSDQSLCKSLEYSMIVKLLTEHHFSFLSLKGGCTGSSESTLVKMPHCWKSHVMAHILFTIYPTLSHPITSSVIRPHFPTHPKFVGLLSCFTKIFLLNRLHLTALHVVFEEKGLFLQWKKKVV